MPISLHPSAIANYDKKVCDFLLHVEQHHPCEKKPPEFKTDIHISAKLTDADIIGDLEQTTTNYKGETINRAFSSNGCVFGLSDKKYQELIELSRKIQHNPALKQKLSTSFIEDQIFTWIKNQYIKAKIQSSFSAFLLQEADIHIGKQIIYIPISNLQTQSELIVGNSRFIPITKDLVNTWKSILKLDNPNTKDLLLDKFESITKKVIGYAATVFEIEAEQGLAINYAIEQSKISTSILGIYSRGAFLPDAKCITLISGLSHIDQANFFHITHDKDLIYSQNALDFASFEVLKLSTAEITRTRNSGLDTITSLLKSEKHSKFQIDVINAIFLYSKSAFTADPVEKIIYILSSLESLLLKSSTEGIQQNLSERLAIFIEKTLPNRTKLIKVIKSNYSIRSNYLHHGKDSNDLELITELQKIAWKFYFSILRNIEKFETKDDFLTALDNLKLS